MRQSIRTIAVSVFVVLLFAPQANATVITETLSVLVVSGPGTGETGTIDISYDDAFLVTGDERLGPDEMALTLTLFGQVFTNTDDADYPEGFPPVPAVQFLSFEMAYVEFVVAEITEGGLGNPTPIDDPRIREFGGVDLVDGVWYVATQPIPKPAAFALLGLGLAGLGLARRNAGSGLREPSTHVWPTNR